MKAGMTEIVCVVDRSGSMQAIQKDAIGSFNRFLADQQATPGDAKFSLTLFNTTYEIPYNGVPLKDVKPFTEKTYRPAGCTALLDAVGKTIDEVGNRLYKTPESDRPAKVLFVVLTDGHENSSVEYNRQQVLDKLAHQRDMYKWEFIFLVAGPEAMNEARKLGIPAQNTYAYHAADPVSANAAMSVLTSNLRKARANVVLGQSVDIDWSNKTGQ